MDLNEVPTLVIDQIGNGVKIEGKHVENFDGVVDKESEESRIKSIEQEQRCREVEEKQLALELEIRNKGMNLEEIKGKIRVLEGEKLRVEEEIKGLMVKKAGLVGANVGGEFSSDEREMDDEDVSRVSQSMVENKVLECEKKIALKEVEVWKRKCEELELCVLELEGRFGKADVSIGINGANTVIGDDVCALSPSRDHGSPSRLLGAIEEVTPIEGSLDKKYVRTYSTSAKQMHVKRRLAFHNEKSCDKKIAPSTPSTVIDIIDCDNDDDVPARPKSEGLPGMMSKYGVQEIDGGIMTPNTKRKRDQVVTSDDECDNYNKRTPNKRLLKLENCDSEGEDKDGDITPTKQSESENDDDDNLPISQLKRNRAQGSQPALPLNPTGPKRCLVKYGQGEVRYKTRNTENHPDTLTSENVADHESSEDESESSVHSLSSFIVDDSDDEDVEDDISKGDTGDNSDDVEDDVSEEDDGGDSDDDGDSLDSNLNYEEIISRFKGRRKPNSKWISEADMLSDFGKNPELCMKAVCAIYRQQTNEEKACKASIVNNGRGFSKFDATRGTYLGEFLTDRVPNGNLVKLVEELQKCYPNGVEECRSLADRYSKQLFNIYENGEDPYFP